MSRKLPREHGTVRGYGQHRQDKTPFCDPCREAWRAHHSAYMRDRRKADPERARAESGALAAARSRLTHLYPLEYRKLLAEEREKRGLS